ncbi:hypothetical protein [Nioella aestuarii]|uniref:hypothetical protein n=1 Tax=Nioella aestuarii TaxID=1662864 RepID=UPI003D7F22C5
MTTTSNKLSAGLISGVLLALAGPAAADMASNATQAVNFFENGQATGGVMMAVDSQGPVAIGDGVELAGFAFGTYDVDFTANSVTMTLVARLENLMITQYDGTTFDRYYFAFDQAVTSAEIAASTDAGFAATVEIIAPGTQVIAAGAFVDGLPTEYTFENGGILLTIGEGTDLNTISANGGSITVNF